MKPSSSVALVAGGYVAAFLLASAVVAVRVANTSGPVAQASSGMYAFGDSVLFVAVFGVCALVPTGAALFFLRPYPRFWTVLSTVALAVATTGVVAAILYAVGRAETGTPLGVWAQVSVLRILIAPLFAFTFLVCTVLSPNRAHRVALIVATVMELAVAAYGGLTWFVPMLLHRT